jgi:hypothetical protein
VESMPAPESGAEPDLTDMDPAAIDGILARLGAVVELCVTQWRAADRAVPEVGDADNPALDPGRDPRWPDPELSLMHAQWSQASNRSSGLAEMAREFAAWWADTATVAMLAAVNRAPVHAVRMNAGDPSRTILGDDLDHLTDLLAGEGVYLFVPDGFAEPRRHQLWGEVWTEHRVPRLPSSEDLIDILTEAGLRVDRVAHVAQGAESVENALAAHKEALTGKAENEAALLAHAAQLTELLAEYARRVATVLPHLRSGDP